MIWYKWQDFRIIRNQHYEQKLATKLKEGLTRWTDIKRGVSQGCITSSDHFNLHSECILEEAEEEIQVNGRRTNNIRYADDTVLLASSEAGLQAGA